MARTILIAGNWKMNTSSASARELASGVAGTRAKLPKTGFEVGVFPPYPWLGTVRDAIAGSGVRLGAQDVAPENNGAFTGDVSGAMLAECGVHYVCIGHSERREYHGEGEPLLAKKISRAREAKLVPIVCCGEPLQVRQRGTQEGFVREQVLGLFAELAKSAPDYTNFVCAYEPIWAIGTGEVATPPQAQQMCLMIRQILADLVPAWGATTILYGGSVKAGNAAELIAQPDIDGFLVGGASLKADEFAQICQRAAEAHARRA